MADRPNVLLFFTDQQRFDTIGALGNPVMRTPNLDRLCREGAAFTSAYSPSPVCVPARCSLHYGQYPMNSGCFDNNFPMPEDGRPSFMDTLTKAGYRTHGIGKCHFTPDSRALRGFQSREVQEEIQPKDADDFMRFLADEGFEHAQEPHGVRGEMYYIPQISVLPEEKHPTQWIGDRSIRFVHEQAKSAEPWMLFSSYIHPHPPFSPPTPWHKLYRAAMMPLPNVPEDVEALHTYINRNQNRYKYRDQGIDRNLLRCMKAHYYACVSFIDYQVGRVLQALEQTGQLDNTVVLFTADHGEHLGDYNCFGKRSMHDSCARIPMLARLPGRFEGGRVCDTPVSLVDVAPTILRAAGLAPEEMDLDGTDLKDIADGTSDREAVFSQYDREGKAIYTMVTPEWKYAYSAADDREFLFDRVRDPRETRNRAGLVFTTDTLDRMRESMMSFLSSVGETVGIESGQWKKYPHLVVSSDPDAGLLIQDPRGFEMNLPGYAD